MTISETKTRTIILDRADIKQAIIMYLKGRGENEISETNIELTPEVVHATIVITTETKPKDEK